LEPNDASMDPSSEYLLTKILLSTVITEFTTRKESSGSV